MLPGLQKLELSMVRAFFFFSASCHRQQWQMKGNMVSGDIPGHVISAVKHVVLPLF